MTTLQITGFNGSVQQFPARLLPPDIGTMTTNQRPGTGDLRAWREGRAVGSAPSGSKTIYRAARDVADSTRYWFAWPNVVHVTRGFDPDDSVELTYFTGDGVPKFTSLAENLAQSGTGQYPRAAAVNPLGVPAPATKPLVEQVAVAEADSVLDPANWLTKRQYVYTYVTDLGWESQASPVSDLVGDHGSPYVYHRVTQFASPPSGYLINRIRIYMLKGTLSGGAGFFFVQEISTGTAEFRHFFQDDYVGEELQTSRWATPPANLTHLTPLWNGMLAGIANGAVRFCEPYYPYSWPLNNDVLPPDSKPVGLGVYGQNLLVLTTGRPVLVNGTSPESLDQQLLEIPQSCVAPRSIVSMGVGVAWASNDGLCWYGQDGARIVTDGILLRDQWLALRPHTIIGCMFENMYFGSYLPDGATQRKGFIISPFEPKGIYYLDKGYEAMYFDRFQDQLFVLDGTTIKQWDAEAVWMEASFTTKLFTMPKHIEAFKVLHMVGVNTATITIGAHMDSVAEAEAVVAARPDMFEMVPDSVVVYYRVTVEGETPVRLPGGFRAKSWQLVITTDTTGSSVVSVTLAHSMAELQETV